MKLFVVFFGLLGVAFASPSGILAAPITYSVAPIVIPAPAAVTATLTSPISRQFHAQDVLGQYTYGYSNGLSAKTETKSAGGLTVGSYSYLDPVGKVQSVEYSSDAAGFRVNAATNLPVAPALPKVEPLPLPVPVEDTPEVVEARARHLAALEEAKVLSVEVSKSEASSDPTALPAVKAASSAESVSSSASATPSIAPATKSSLEESSSSSANSTADSVAIANATTNPAEILAKALLTPTFSVATPVVAAPAYGYSINSLHGLGLPSTLLSQPAITTYTAPILTAPVFVSEGWATKAVEKTKEDKV